MSRPKRTVLVVEDNEFNRTMLEEVLGADFNVIEAENGKIGLEILAQHYNELSLILLDIYMPVCDGFEFLKQKRADERYAPIPVIVATASGSIQDEITCLELGANDFVLKPYNFEIMINRLNNMINLRESASIVNQLTWDSVTGLYNRAFFNRAAEDIFASSGDANFDMLCCFVVNFETLNDRYGESSCNTLLHDLAASISSCFPSFVAGGRIGTAKFAFLVEHGSHDWEHILKDAIQGMPFANANIKFGVVEKLDKTMPAAAICNRGLNAIRVIANYHDRIVAFFDDSLHQRQLLEELIFDSMKTALNEQQFTVFFQPKHDVHTGRVGGAEALVRWFHPTIGSISPAIFIPVFERSGFITKLDFFVWEEACQEVGRCQKLGLPVVPVSVNVSRLDFNVPDLPARIAQIADDHNIEHSLLHVELTETAYSDNPSTVIKVLNELKDLGFSIELDDYGAGYSSLEALNTLPLDVMKLDMSMVRKAVELNDYRIMESTLKLARALDLQTVVEGVETADAAKRVAELGSDYIQGFYYSAPLDHKEFEKYLETDGQ